MTVADKPDNQPLFQAIGDLAGRLTMDEWGSYRLELLDGVSLPAFVWGRVFKLIRSQPELLGQVQAWRVYPKTDRQGKLTCVHLIGVSPQAHRQMDEFHISGRVVPAQGEGLIGVRIEPNRRSQQREDEKSAVSGNSFSPFYINLQGSPPGDIEGEIWRFICQRAGERLEMIDGVRVRRRRQKPRRRGGRKPTGPVSDFRSPTDAKEGGEASL